MEDQLFVIVWSQSLTICEKYFLNCMLIRKSKSCRWDGSSRQITEQFKIDRVQLKEEWRKGMLNGVIKQLNYDTIQLSRKRKHKDFIPAFL